MWKKIKTFLPWIISIIYTYLLSRFFTRKNSLGDEHSGTAREIVVELDRSRELTAEGKQKLDSISERIESDETRLDSIEKGFTSLEERLTECKEDSRDIEEINRENINILQELQNRYDEGYSESSDTK